MSASTSGPSIIGQNDRTIRRREIEARILKALKQNLLTPELVAEFTRAYQEEVNRLTKEAGGRAAELESKLVAVQRKIDGIMRAIEDGLYQPSRSEANPRDLHCGHRTQEAPAALCARGLCVCLVAGTGFEPVTFRL